MAQQTTDIDSPPPAEAPADPSPHKPKVPLKYDVAHIGDRGIGGGVNFYSLEKEELLGHELAQQVEQGAHLLADPVITACRRARRRSSRLWRGRSPRIP